jgi:hypothetical protein
VCLSSSQGVRRDTGVVIDHARTGGQRYGSGQLRTREDTDTGAAGYAVKKKETIARRGRRGYSGRVSGGVGAKNTSKQELQTKV